MTPEHKPSDLDLWARACERVGKWKRGCYCVGEWSHDPIPNCRKCGARIQWNTPVLQGESYTTESHEIPVPPIGEAECVVAMLEWLIPEQGNFLAFWRHGDLFNVEVTTIREHSSLPLALAAAVVAIPKEPDHA